MVNRTEKLKDCLQGYIRTEMSKKKISQEEMAFELGISQPTFSHDLKLMRFDAIQLAIIFEILKTSQEDIGRMMTL